jgi:hypothetical protein
MSVTDATRAIRRTLPVGDRVAVGAVVVLLLLLVMSSSGGDSASAGTWTSEQCGCWRWLAAWRRRGGGSR